MAGRGSDSFTDRQGRLRLHSLTEKGNREGLRLHPVMDRGATVGQYWRQRQGRVLVLPMAGRGSDSIH